MRGREREREGKGGKGRMGKGRKGRIEKGRKGGKEGRKGGKGIRCGTERSKLFLTFSSPSIFFASGVGRRAT